MRASSFSVALVFGAAATQAQTCVVGPSFGCFADSGTRPVPYLVQWDGTPSTTLSREQCAGSCAASGLPVAAVTSHGAPTPGGFCYCGAAVSPASSPAPLSSCSNPCPGNSSETCGADGFSFAFNVSCDGPLPPAPNPIGPPLAPGRACSQPETKGWLFCDHTQPLEARVSDLVSRFTILELGQQLTSRSSPPVPRLGLPGFYWGSNAIHGVLSSGCLPAGQGGCPTSWPDGVALNSAWNATAFRMMGFVTARESRAFDNLFWSKELQPTGGLTLWGPTINNLRDTRWGRTQESCSEDPALCSAYAVNVALGMQNNTGDPRYLFAVATFKHLAMYSLEQYGPPSDPTEWERQTFNAVASPFDLGDSYLPQFKAGIQQGGAAGVMYAANEVNGVPGCGSTYLDGLLHDWGFNGYRCTDGGQIINMVDGHKYVPTLDQAIALAIAAESDIADGSEYYNGLSHAYFNGNATLEGARNLLSNAMRIRLRLGQFDPPENQPFLLYNASDIGAPDATAANALASREALVLLKNGNYTSSSSSKTYVASSSLSSTAAAGPAAAPLPLVPGASWAAAGALAVIGPNCDSTLVLQGNYGGQFCHSGPHGPVYDCYPSIFGALSGAGLAPGAVFAQGSTVDASDPALLQAAVAAAASASAVVMCLGLDQTQEREQLDRYINMTLPDAQMQLFNAVAGAVAAAGKGAPIIVVLVHGGSLAIPEIASQADAIIDAFYPGVMGGSAIADAIFGAFSPGGKLPYTIYDVDYQYALNFTDMTIAAPRPASVGPGKAAAASRDGGWLEWSSIPWALLSADERRARMESMLLPPSAASDPSSSTATMSAAPAIAGRSYRYYTGQALWPFGFGLSYTPMALSWGSPAPPAAVAWTPSSPPLQLSVAVTNHGTAMAGDEVPQLYVAPHAGSFGALEPPFLPIKALRSFARVTVAAGATALVPFTLSVADLALTQADGSAAPLPGTYTVLIWRGQGEDILSFDVQLSA